MSTEDENKEEIEKAKDCECESFILLRSYNLKICTKCRKEYPWHLDKGQNPLITSSKDRGM